VAAFIKGDLSMHLFRRLPLFLVLLFMCLPAFALPTTLDADGGIRKAGERWFPLGLYEVPKDASEAALFREAGFDLVRAEADPAVLNLLSDQGLQGWIPLGGHSIVQDETAAMRLLNHIQPVQNHPALAIWELPDEALWNVRQMKLEASDAEREEVRKLVNQSIRVGSPEAEALKSLYRDLVLYHARQDHDRYEQTLRSLWDALGHPDRPMVSNLSRIEEEEPVLFWQLLNAYRQLRAADPDHLVWQNHAPRNSLDMLTKHAAYCDLIGCDIYPAPDSPPGGHSDLATRWNTSVGDYTRRFVEAGQGRGVLMVLQAFAWKQIADMGEAYADTDKGREPRYLESRFMAYDAIVNGAKGLAYWGSQFDRAQSGKTWKELVPVIQELASIQEFLAAPETQGVVTVDSQPSWFSQDCDVLTCARKVGEDWLFILVNEDDSPHRIHLDFAPEFAGMDLNILYQGVGWKVQPGQPVQIDLVGNGVHLISNRADLEVPELRDWNREIREPFPKSQ
jgi:hypothetical protein